MPYCSYYQAHVIKKTAWCFTALLRSYDHLVFDRTLDKASSTFEFFVPQGLEPAFEEVMALLEKRALVENVVKLPNRFLSS